MSEPPIPLALINARLEGGDMGTLRLAGGGIAGLQPPQAGDRIIDLEGDRVLPGLINAHDHLQLNSLPSLEHRSPYVHVRQWIEDINTRRRDDPDFEALVAVARDTRLLVGCIKNLLSGVTTVAHHDPLYPFLESADCPVRIVTRYGWSHSLYIDGAETVRTAYRRTPADWPWIIHAAEGVDEEAAREFEQLEALGCVAANTLLVHGVALDRARCRRLEAAAAGLIWCPTSNLRLFGRTANAGDLIRGGRVALGTDSRLSGARDLLDELRQLRNISDLDESSMEALVTGNGARLLRLPDRGALRAGYRADLVILPGNMALSSAVRADVRMVLIEGSVRYADSDYAASLQPAEHWVRVRVDGRGKLLQRRIAEMLRARGAAEDGLELDGAALQAA